MSAISRFVRRSAEIRRRFGLLSLVELMLYRAVNRFVNFRQYDLVVAERGDLREVTSPEGSRFAMREATLSELQQLANDERWQIGEAKLANFRAGDVCLLSCEESGAIAGYTWASRRDRTDISSTLTISLPRDHLYSYAALTQPEYRGQRLQSIRHRGILETSIGQRCRALFSYAEHVNFASRAAQRRTGFRRAGTIWLIGPRDDTDNFVMLRSAGAKKLGVRRLASRPVVAAPAAAPAAVPVLRRVVSLPLRVTPRPMAGARQAAGASFSRTTTS